jgi:uncharacterized flavoprotein (TIGR03862 family)
MRAMSSPPGTSPVVELAIVGGGPAGLMAAHAALAHGVRADVFDAMGSVGRKFLVAGKGGLNLTHSERRPGFDRRYRERAREVGAWLDVLDADGVRAWARTLGVDTFVGTSGRVFPLDLKAAPLLRGWVRRLREAGVRFHVHHRFTGWTPDEALAFATPAGERAVRAQATVLALGGGSWPRLGSDGAWVDGLRAHGIDVRALAPSNCGFEVAWSPHFASRFAGHAVKPVALSWHGVAGAPLRRQGEFVVAGYGVEGSLVYAASADLRDAIAAQGSVEVRVDVLPRLAAGDVLDALAAPRGGRSLSEILRRRLGLDGVRAGLVHECTTAQVRGDPARLAPLLQSLPLTLQRPRPLAEAISSAGGVRLEALDDGLMSTARPGLHCAGEMLDWEAPTGGYLLTACLASGRVAGDAAARRVRAGASG